MGGGRAAKLETLVECVAAATLALAVACCAFAVAVHHLPQHVLAFVCLALMGTGYSLAVGLLRLICGGGPHFALPRFELTPLDFDPWDELLLTEQPELLLTEQPELILSDADRVQAQKSAEDELILDDILAKLGSDSRVVRLFDPLAMPTPGQLDARIKNHLRQGSAPPQSADASDALMEALTQLRRSLR